MSAISQQAANTDTEQRCFTPGCRTAATVIDWAGWCWCDEHKDKYGDGDYKPLEGRRHGGIDD